MSALGPSVRLSLSSCTTVRECVFCGYREIPYPFFVLLAPACWHRIIGTAAAAAPASCCDVCPERWRNSSNFVSATQGRYCFPEARTHEAIIWLSVAVVMIAALLVVLSSNFDIRHSAVVFVFQWISPTVSHCWCRSFESALVSCIAATGSGGLGCCCEVEYRITSRTTAVILPVVYRR